MGANLAFPPAEAGKRRGKQKPTVAKVRDAATKSKLKQPRRDGLVQKLRSKVRTRSAAAPGMSSGKRRHLIRLLDGVVSRVHSYAKDARIQFTGSFVYAGATHDIDIRLVGISVEDAIRSVRNSFPGLKPIDVREKAPYLEGVRHVQVDLKNAEFANTQLDLSVYENPTLFDKPHQWITFAKVKLEVRPGAKLSHVVRRIEKKRTVENEHVLDPSKTGMKDLQRGRLKVHQETGASQARLPEGLLHAMYLVGKPRPLEMGLDSIRLYQEMGAPVLADFFSPALHGEKIAGRRFGYILSSFRVQSDRTIQRSIELGRRTGFWRKVLPEMSRVTSFVKAWRLVSRRVKLAQTSARLSGKSRAYVFGAFLSELSVGEFEAVLARFAVPERESPAGILWAEDIREGYRDFHPRLDVPLE